MYLVSWCVNLAAAISIKSVIIATNMGNNISDLTAADTISTAEIIADIFAMRIFMAFASFLVRCKLG